MIDSNKARPDAGARVAGTAAAAQAEKAAVLAAVIATTAVQDHAVRGIVAENRKRNIGLLEG